MAVGILIYFLLKKNIFILKWRSNIVNVAVSSTVALTRKEIHLECSTVQFSVPI